MSFSVAYVQIKNYWSDPLLVCNCLFIDLTFCLCAIEQLLETNPCLCADPLLLNYSIAYMQNMTYWFYLLLMYMYSSLLNCLIVYVQRMDYWDLVTCLYARRVLLNRPFAYVQLSAYWLLILLVYNFTVIEVLSCSCAIYFLLSIPIVACLQLYYYWNSFLLMCKH